MESVHYCIHCHEEIQEGNGVLAGPTLGWSHVETGWAFCMPNCEPPTQAEPDYDSLTLDEKERLDIRRKHTEWFIERQEAWYEARRKEREDGPESSS